MRHRSRFGSVALLLLLAPSTSSIPAKPLTPRTSWGDPDLQGTYTNTNESGTPFERPDQFAGRTLEDVTGEELKAFRQAQQRTLEQLRTPFDGADASWQSDPGPGAASQAWLVVDPPDGKIPPLTAAARQRIAARIEALRKSGRGPADSWTDRSLYDRCITRGYPSSMLPTIYGNQYEIVQAPGIVAIRYEMIHETRVIPLDDATPRHAVLSYMGTPHGHWEGDTLVVVTTGFKQDAAFQNANGATLTLTERFTRISAQQVQWSVTVDDPDTWTRPWTFSLPLTSDPTPVLAYDCHEGNYGLRNMLSAARADEASAAAPAAY